MGNETTARAAGPDDLAGLARDITLVIGGVFALHPPGDEVVADITRGVERAYRRARARLLERQAAGVPRHYPAIAELLRVLDEVAGRPANSSAGNGFTPIPGLFCSCEVADLIEQGEAFHVERAGALDEIPLFAVFRRERANRKEN
jgi:hypothetical protein